MSKTQVPLNTSFQNSFFPEQFWVTSLSKDVQYLSKIEIQCIIMSLVDNLQRVK